MSANTVPTLLGRTALITGAPSWTGQGIARSLAAQGARIAVNDIDAAKAAGLAAELSAEGHAAHAAVFDVTDFEAVRRGMADVERAFAPIDIVVNNVGMLRQRLTHHPFEQTSPEEWKPWVELNIYGSLNCVRWALPGMLQRRWGRIIQISTTLASRGLPNRESLYAGSKAGIEGALRNIAMEVADKGVTVNTLAVSLLKNAVDLAAPDVVAATLAKIPLGRYIEPREVGAAAAWLASPDAACVTGQTIHLNGGAYHGR